MQEFNLAAVDLGSNSFHMIIARIKTNGSFEVLSKDKESVRLGSGSEDWELLTPEAIERGIQCLKRFQKIAKIHNAEIRAIATSALREAKNRAEFVHRASEELGLNVEIISGFEEARLIYFGILQGLQVYDKRILMIDIGGGSTEVLIGQKTNIIFAQSLKLGAVRLTEKFFKQEPISSKSIEECRNYIRGFIAPIIWELKKYNPEMIIGSSGTVQTIANVLLAESGEQLPRSLNNYVYNSESLKKIVKLIIESDTVKRRLKIPGLEPKRAEIIVGGSLILDELFDLLKIKSITVSDFALREGIIYDTMRKLENKEHQPYTLDNLRKKTIENIFIKFSVEKEHSLKVQRFSLKLFDQLKELHQCEWEHREYLEAASMLHEVGFAISHSEHHKHSYYIIRNAESMAGFNFDEIEIIALIARYHRKSTPKPKHVEFDKLSNKNQEIVKKLSSILRIADGLDRSRLGSILDFECNLTKDKLIIHLLVSESSDPQIDIWASKQKGQMFEELFQKKIEFIV